MMPNTWHGIVQKKYEEVNLNNVYEWTRMSEMRSKKKIYTQNIIRTKHDSAIRYTNNMCNFRAWVWIFSTTWSTNKNKPQKTAFRIQRITIITCILPRIFGLHSGQNDIFASIPTVRLIRAWTNWWRNRQIRAIAGWLCVSHWSTTKQCNIFHAQNQRTLAQPKAIFWTRNRL